MTSPFATVWFRDDLRLADNPSLVTAVESGLPVHLVHIDDDGLNDLRPLGSAQKVWRDKCIDALEKDLGKKGHTLHRLAGNPAKIFSRIASGGNFKKLYLNKALEPVRNRLDTDLARILKDLGVTVEISKANYLHDPESHLTGGGSFYKVYTPFWKAFLSRENVRLPLPAPELAPIGKDLPNPFEAIAKATKKPLPQWAPPMIDDWKEGEENAHKHFDNFLESGLGDYSEGRNFPARSSVSKMSPYLRFGVVSPYQLWHRAAYAMDQAAISPSCVETFHKELGWREFSAHLHWHFPELATKNFNSKFDNFPWKTDYDALERWQKGQTGIPIVDAGMRQLWQTGWMHNRVRMIVASFLVKHLLVDWRAGEAWFWDTLMDGDPASNPASWQWVAGSGADAAPYFRIFNPVLQSKKFDGDGDYIRQFVPELGNTPARTIHDPEKLVVSKSQKGGDLFSAGKAASTQYPPAMISLAEGRESALAAFKQISG